MNIDRFSVLTKKGREQAQKERDRRPKRKPKDRAWHYLALIDLKKAFDSISRVDIINLLLGKGIEVKLVEAVKNQLNHTFALSGEQMVQTHIGVP